MSIEPLLGYRATLTVLRIGQHGAFLDVDGHSDDTLLLPGVEIPEGTEEGDAIQVFVYRDSEGRPITTTRPPRLELGQVTFLEVTDVTRIGAFVDWGPPKELLVPFAEQTQELRPGDFHPFGLFLDRSGRLAGTMRIREMLGDGTDLAVDSWLRGEAWRREPGVGLFVIVEKRALGLVPECEPHRLRRGEEAEFRIVNVLPDGKLMLSLRGHVHEELEHDAAHVLARLRVSGTPRVSDRSSPEQLRALFGLSRKAFKRAVGRLLKRGAVELDDHGLIIVRPRGAAGARPR